MSTRHAGVSAEDLAAIDLLSGLEPGALAELASRTEERRLEPGDWLWREGEEPTHFFVIFEGVVDTLSEVDDTVLSAVAHTAGGFVGAMPVLTGQPYIVASRATSPTRAGAIGRDDLRQLLHDHIEIEQRVLRVFATTVRRIEGITQQREKMTALGTMAAGLAHELNNPAAAAARSASELAEALGTLQRTMGRFVHSGVERAEAERFVELQREALECAAKAPELDALEASDREDAIQDWLEAHDVPETWRLAPALVAAGLGVEWLDRAAKASGPALSAGIDSLVAALSAGGLIAELHDSTSRISNLVSAIKEYTYMDQAPQQDVDVHHGLDTTLTILKHKLRHTEITVERHYDPELPRVSAWGSELNQVWTNLIDNAIDALGDSGTITISTARDREWLRVEVADDGPGIPPEVQARVFEPFFTTKAPGDGTGLGLETAYRIVVQRHRGRLDVESRPGDTRFIARLPIAPAA